MSPIYIVKLSIHTFDYIGSLNTPSISTLDSLKYVKVVHVFAIESKIYTSYTNDYNVNVFWGIYGLIIGYIPNIQR